jgi:hypothetical protein
MLALGPYEIFFILGHLISSDIANEEKSDLPFRSEQFSKNEGSLGGGEEEFFVKKLGN